MNCAKAKVRRTYGIREKGARVIKKRIYKTFLEKILDKQWTV